MKPREVQRTHRSGQMTLGRDGKSSTEQKEELHKMLIDDQGEERRRDDVSVVAFRL